MVAHDSETASGGCPSGMSLASVDRDRRNRTALAAVIPPEERDSQEFRRDAGGSARVEVFWPQLIGVPIVSLLPSSRDVAEVLRKSHRVSRLVGAVWAFGRICLSKCVLAIGSSPAPPKSFESSQSGSWASVHKGRSRLGQGPPAIRSRFHGSCRRFWDRMSGLSANRTLRTLRGATVANHGWSIEESSRQSSSAEEYLSIGACRKIRRRQGREVPRR
jgi:hypothetical protein